MTMPNGVGILALSVLALHTKQTAERMLKAKEFASKQQQDKPAPWSQNIGSLSTG